MPYVDHFQYGGRRTPLLRTSTNRTSARMLRFYTAADGRPFDKPSISRKTTVNCAINRFIKGFYRM